MIYIISLNPQCLEWLSKQSEATQALVGWTLTNRGVPRDHLNRNYDVTPEDLEKMMLLNWGRNYHNEAERIEYGDDFYEFVPAYRYPRLIQWIHKFLPFLLVFLFGLTCGLDWI